MQILGGVFLAQRLAAQLSGGLWALRQLLGPADQIMQRLMLTFGVEVSNTGRRVVGTQLFADPSIAGSGHVASGKMDQAGVVGPAHKIQDVHGGIDVGSQGIAQVGIKVGQAGAVDNQVQPAPQAGGNLRGQSEPRLARIAFNNVHPFREKSCQTGAIALMKGVKDRGFLDHLFKTPQRGIGLLPPDEQVDSADFRQVREKVDQPDLSYETGHANQHDVPARQGAAYRQRMGLAAAVKAHKGTVQDLLLSFRREARSIQGFPAGKAEITHQLLG